jgi:hypothetical protein
MNSKYKLPNAPHPTQCLPHEVCDFSLKVATQTQTDPSLAATVAIVAMAAASQGLVDVVHPNGFVSPTSMNAYVNTKSGGGKSAVDHLVNKSILQFAESYRQHSVFT